MNLEFLSLKNCSPQWVLAIIITLLALNFIYIWRVSIKKYGRFRFEYLIQPYKLARYTRSIALFYSLLIVGSSVAFDLYLLEESVGCSSGYDWMHKKGLDFFVFFCAFFLGTWGLLVSYNVLKQQKSQLVGFNEFLVEVRDSLRTLNIKAGNSSTPKYPYEVYIHDYHPLVGIYSAPAKYAEYIEEFKGVLRNQNINVFLLTNHESNLNDFFQKLSIDSDADIAKNSIEPMRFIKEFEENYRSAAQHSLLWKGGGISDFHFMIIDDASYQYVVLPQDGVNEIYGTKSEDSFVRKYLEDSFDQKVIEVLSPNKITCNDGSYIIEFQPQSNIEKVNLINNSGTAIHSIDSDDLIRQEGLDSDVCGFRCQKGIIRHFPFQYELIKRGYKGRKKFLSRKIFYRELVSLESRLRVVYHQADGNDDFATVTSLIQSLQNDDYVLSVTLFFDSEKIDFNRLSDKLSDYRLKLNLVFVAQAPEKDMALEVVYAPSKVHYEYNASKNGCGISSFKMFGKECLLITAFLYDESELDKSIRLGFKRLESVLDKRNIGWDKIERQWNYIDDITGIVVGNTDSSSNKYNVFCGVRAEYYGKHLTNQVEEYPAATGIGVKLKNSFGLSAFVVNDNVKIENLSISSQQAPEQYRDVVLVGLERPLFRRGKRLFLRGDEFQEPDITFVSGTAAIVEDKSVESDTDDLLEVQVNVTVKAITQLLNHNENRTLSIRNLSYVRVYYKGSTATELERIKLYLNPLLKNVPHIFLKTNICRSSLHIEIEGARF